MEARSDTKWKYDGHVRLVAIVASASLVLLSCGRAPNAPATTLSPRDEWSARSWEERHDVMTWVVLPNLARTFQRWKKSADPSLTCRTCHGKDAEEVDYRMPHGLPPLARIPSPGDPSLTPTERFMIDEVTPQMRELLGSPTLSCNSCHPRT